MAVIITNVKTDISSAKEDIISAALKRAGLSKKDVLKAEVHKTSLDARHNNRIALVSSVWVELDDPNAENKLCSLPFCKAAARERFMPDIPKDPPKNEKKTVIAGFGPAGMFAALVLAEYGFEPIVLERGGSVDERVEKVNRFWSSGILDISTNVQFGEGGAGTFSDGKLNTQTRDGLNRDVLKLFHRFGAPEEILYLNKPHIGSDRLFSVLVKMRGYIEERGGKYLFNTLFTGFESKNGKLTGLCLKNAVSGEESFLPVEYAVLALGHSSRDTFYRLNEFGVAMQPRDFAVGVRIEHLSENISRAQYGESYKKLPAADYKLVSHAHERTVFTFCMCPGGVVIPAASEDGGVVVNGMSLYARDGVNSNSALMVQMKTHDFGGGLFDGVEFQRRLERLAFKAGGGDFSAPVQLVGDFMKDRVSRSFGAVKPTYAAGTAFADLREVLPAVAVDALKSALPDLNARLRGFSADDAVMTGVESRFSSPVRILRDENCESVSVGGLYPCGEGSGYSGGITSSAADGLRVAEIIYQRHI